MCVVMTRYVCVLLALGFAVVVSKVSDRRGPLNLAFSKMAVFDEMECLRVGGRCLDREECPEGKLSDVKGLCPEQQKRDVECCHGAARSVRDCHILGGECTSNPCADRAKIPQADDCPAQQYCCALLL